MADRIVHVEDGRIVKAGDRYAANNNQSVIRRMAKRSLVSNKRRTIIMALAVALSAFMLFLSSRWASLILKCTGCRISV